MSKRKRFRELINAPGMVYAPGAYDALSARIIEAQGFDVVVAGGYAAVGVLLGQPDTGQSNVRDYTDHYGRICAAVSVPVYVDGDTGFGGVNNVRQMVRAFEDAGVAGLFIGDQVFPNRCGYMEGKQLVPAEEMLSKLKAALDARRDSDLYIVARIALSNAPSFTRTLVWTWRKSSAPTGSMILDESFAKCPGPKWPTCRTPIPKACPRQPSSRRRAPP